MFRIGVFDATLKSIQTDFSTETRVLMRIYFKILKFSLNYVRLPR